nr:hypothetical protein [Halolamina rubra]
MTGFDTSVFEDRDDRFDWQQDESTVSRDRMTRAWERFKRNRTALVGLGIIAVMLFTTIFARPIVIEGITIQPFSLAPFDPTNSNFAALNEAPTAAHPFGTDWSGKDILSRVMFGGRYSLTIGVITVGIALSVGVPLGASRATTAAGSTRSSCALSTSSTRSRSSCSPSR